MAIVNNPVQFTIVDPKIAVENVTGFNVEFGLKSGVYTLKAAVPAKDLVGDAAAGSVTGPISDLNTQLAPGTWFAAATAVNANGESAVSPETSFTITPPLPSAPTGFSVS